MDVLSVSDLREVSNLMHDSEFGEEDFGYDEKNKIFHINTEMPIFEKKFFCLEKRVPGQINERFKFELHNIEKYNPRNLNKIRMGKGLGGVFNFIKIRDKGHKLTIVSQELHIDLELSKLEGVFERY